MSDAHTTVFVDMSDEIGITGINGYESMSAIFFDDVHTIHIPKSMLPQLRQAIDEYLQQTEASSAVS